MTAWERVAVGGIIILAFFIVLSSIGALHRILHWLDGVPL